MRAIWDHILFFYLFTVVLTTFAPNHAALAQDAAAPTNGGVNYMSDREKKEWLYSLANPAPEQEKKPFTSTDLKYMSKKDRLNWEKSQDQKLVKKDALDREPLDALVTETKPTDTLDGIEREALAPLTQDDVSPAKQAAKRVEEIENSDNQKQNLTSRCQVKLKHHLEAYPIDFLPGKHKPAFETYETISKVADILKECKDANVLIEGHTDSRGQPQANQRLSGERANSVLLLLVKTGVNKKRLRAIGIGADRPVASNDTVEDRALNRRIEFKLY